MQEVTSELSDRLSRFDVHPSGPLYGFGENPVTGEIRNLEAAIYGENRKTCEGLERFGLRLQRRATRMRTYHFGWNLSANHELELSFYLVAGGYATSVLGPLVAADIR